MMKLGVFIVFLSFLGLTIGAIFVTRGLIYKYVARLQSPSVIWILTRLHFLTALLTGFFLPNNYLNSFETIRRYYEASGVLILVSIFAVFVISLIVIGLILNFIFAEMGWEAKNIQAYEVQKNGFKNFLKKKMGL